MPFFFHYNFVAMTQNDGFIGQEFKVRIRAYIKAEVVEIMQK